jgi:hypothetical protein
MTEYQPTPQTPEEVADGLRDAMKQAKEGGVFTFPENAMFIHQPKQSNWTCYLFGGNTSFSPITWTPEEGKVPNAWVRFWMKVFFDCNWVKNK